MPSSLAMIREPRDGQHQGSTRLLVMALSAGLALTTAACGYLLLRDRDTPPRLGGKRRRGDKAGPMPVEGSEVFPPLPEPVVALLQSTRLCHLSTTGGDGVPHLSLMRFTYLREEEAIVMTTRTDTKKYELLLLERSPKVAVLVHDFPHIREAEQTAAVEVAAATSTGKGSKGNTYSITLNGVARVQQGAEAERYRALHLQNNKAYAQFIEGPNIAVFSVHVVSARICNIQDKVTHWSAADASSSSSSSSSSGEGGGVVTGK